jgi:hypothetical protein
MADYEFNLAADAACNGRAGGYQAVAHLMLGRQRKRVQAAISSTQLSKAKEPGAVIRLVQDAVGERLSGLVEPNQLIAVSIARMCMRGTHVVGERTLANSSRPERVAAYAIARSHLVEELAPLSKLEKPVSSHGIGHARRVTPGMAPIDPLIYLPTTADEAKKYSVVAAVRSLADGPSLSKQPYVALHFSAESMLEQIITPDML